MGWVIIDVADGVDGPILSWTMGRVWTLDAVQWINEFVKEFAS